jgi:Flp pilus assembly protein TadB
MRDRERPTLRVIEGTPPETVRSRSVAESRATAQSAERATDPLALSGLEWGILRFATSLAAGMLALSLAVFARLAPHVGLGLVLAAVLCGALAPALLRAARQEARRRRVRRALPLALDLLAIFIAAGLSLESALRRLAELRNDAFAEELRRVLGDRKTDSGVAALRELAKRTGLIEVAELADRLATSDRFGSRTADVLRDQLARLRARSARR